MFNWDTRLLILGTPQSSGTTHTVNLADTVSFTDSLVRTVTLALSDTLTLSDALVLAVSKTLTDQVTFSDVLEKSTTKALSDQIDLSDLLLLAFTKALSDQLTLTDSRTASVSKSLSDQIDLSDALGKGLTKPLSDQIDLSDALNSEFTKSITDQITLTDDQFRSVTKRLSDQISLSDSLTKQLLAVRASIKCAVDAIYAAICRDVETASGGLDPLDTTYHAEGFYRYDRDELEFLTGQSIDRRVQVTVDASRGIAGLITRGEQIREITLTLHIGYFLGDHASASNFVIAQDTRQIQQRLSKQSTWGACGRLSVKPVKSRPYKVDNSRIIWETEIEVQL